MADCRNRLSGNAHHVDEPDANGVRAESAECEVVFVGAEGIGVAFDDKAGLGIALQELAEFFQARQGAGLEAVAQMAELGEGPPDMVIMPCGGGGLAAGLALALPEARVVVVEPEVSPNRSLSH